jgi:hypothetical protein
MQSAADVIEVVAELGRGSLKQQHTADVHVRTVALLVQE